MKMQKSQMSIQRSRSFDRREIRNIKSQMPAGLLYDVPWLVRDPNDFRMSEKRHQIEVRNQAVVDDYFLSRANGASAREARKVVATKHGITERRFHYIFVWFYREAKKRGKFDFCEKFFTPDGTLK